MSLKGLLLGRSKGGKVMPGGNSTREHLEILHSLILQTNGHALLNNSQEELSHLPTTISPAHHVLL